MFDTQSASNRRLVYSARQLHRLKSLNLVQQKNNQELTEHNHLDDEIVTENDDNESFILGYN